jgi:hypothetical protein
MLTTVHSTRSEDAKGETDHNRSCHDHVDPPTRGARSPDQTCPGSVPLTGPTLSSSQWTSCTAEGYEGDQFAKRSSPAWAIGNSIDITTSGAWCQIPFSSNGADALRRSNL